jgi:hypothetical protein
MSEMEMRTNKMPAAREYARSVLQRLFSGRLDTAVAMG